MYNSPPIGNHHSTSFNRNEPKPKSGVFKSAGIFISGQDDSIQHNYRYQPDLNKKRDSEFREITGLRRFQSEANFQDIARVNPGAYQSYANNLEKIGNKNDHLDAYADKVQTAKEKLFKDQLNLQNLQKLNRFNADLHRQHTERQLQKMRAPVTESDVPPLRPKTNRRQIAPEEYQSYMSEGDQELKLSLLDQFSASRGLNDHLSSYVPSGQVTGRSNGIDQSLVYPEVSHFNPSARRPTANPLIQALHAGGGVYHPNQFAPPPVYNNNPIPYQLFGMPGMPGYGYIPPPPSTSAENNELKGYMQKQTELLERISDKIAKKRDSAASYRKDAPRDYEARLKDFEKETELRLQIMKQQQTIENLQQNKFTASQPSQRQIDTSTRESRYRQKDEYRSQNKANLDMITPQCAIALVQSFMQYLQPLSAGADPYANPMMMNQYGPYMDPYGYGYGYMGQPYNLIDPYAGFPSHRGNKHKKKKKKAKRKSSKDSGDPDSEDDSDGSESDDNDSDDGSRGKSKKHKKGSRKDRNKSKSKKDKKGKGKMDEERKKKAKSNLRIILWASAYPRFFQTDISTKVATRKQAQQQLVNQKLDPLTQNLATWLMNISQEGVTQLFEDIKKPYDFIGLDFKKVSKSDMSKRIADIKKQITFLLQNLINKTATSDIEEGNLESLADISYGIVYGSDNTFTIFELARLKFNSLQRIENLGKDESEMIIGSLLFIRVFVYQLLFKANEWNKKIKWTPQGLANFKIVASLLYHIALSVWEEKLAIVNEEPLGLGFKPIKALTIDPVLAPVDEGSDSPEIIFGALTRGQLAPVLEEEKEWTGTVKASIVEWLGQIYLKIQQYRKENPQIGGAQQGGGEGDG